ncbi:hypothetical protein [Novipirellula caenicola]|uniref:hypothetical protein n=1 Tax=Novipirellula caenicola TaxID=1536901 RepID=UPI0031EF7097
MRGTGGGSVERGIKDWSQFGKDRAKPQPGLNRVDADPILCPVNVGPGQPGNFRRATQPTKTRQCEDQPPVVIGAGFQNCSARGSINEVMAGFVRFVPSLLIGERVCTQQPIPYRISEHRLGSLDVF